MLILDEDLRCDMPTKETIDWSTERYRQMLIDQRRRMWRDDTLDCVISWLGVRSAMTVVDVGAGLGYLGRAFGPAIGNSGNYIGVDVSAKLLDEARRASAQTSMGCNADFVCGNAGCIPIESDSSDIVMCQTLLMHLPEPEVALREMMRIAKPGGLLLCIEPDNLSVGISIGFQSVPRMSVDDQLGYMKLLLLSNKGRIKLGRGDHSVGAKVTLMMNDLGLKDVEARINDRVRLLLPPYDSAYQQDYFEMTKKRFFTDSDDESSRKTAKEEFIAGGGTGSDFDSIYEMLKSRVKLYREQLENRTFSSCSGYLLYIAKGRKPIGELD